MVDTMISFRSNNLDNHFLTNDELKAKCPYAFLTEPTNPKVSDKYTMATTIDVVNDMEKLGWYPVEAKQCRTKRNSSGIRSFHMIAFQNPNLKIMNGDNVEAYPRIILQNSHDSFNSFKFMCGLYRIICSNGLIVADAEFAKLSIRHINYDFEELRTIVIKMIDELPNKINIINVMRNTNLTNQQKVDFATKVIKLRKNVPMENKIEISENTINDILTPIRKEDEGNTLWNVFNVLQEKVIKGDFIFSKNNDAKGRKMRKITSPIKDVKINTDLFSLANEYIKVAA